MARVQSSDDRAKNRLDASRHANKIKVKSMRKRKLRSILANKQVNMQPASAWICQDILPADYSSTADRENDAGGSSMHTDEIPYVTLVHRGPPTRKVDFEVVQEDGCKLIMDIVREVFQLETVQLDGKTVDLDAEGYTVQGFEPGSTVTVTGEPSQTYVPSGEMVIVELEGDPSTYEHFHLYDLTSSGGRIHLDLVRLTFGLSAVTLNGLVLGKQKGTALSKKRFHKNTIIKITDVLHKVGDMGVGKSVPAAAEHVPCDQFFTKPTDVGMYIM